MVDFPWAEVQRLRSRELKTLGDPEIFEVIRITDFEVEIRPRKGIPKAILRSSFNFAWLRMLAKAKLEISDLNRIQEKRGSYLAAILRQLPNVQWADRPVRVWLEDRTAPKVQTQPATRVIGNAGSLVYHLTKCEYGRKIWSRNRVEFPSVATARARGYRPCPVCDPPDI